MTDKIQPLSPSSAALLPDASDDEQPQLNKKALPKKQQEQEQEQDSDVTKRHTEGLFDEFV